MSRPPLVLRVRCVDGNGKRLRLWIPLLLIWLLLLALVMLVAPIVLLAALISGRGSKPWAIVVAFPRMIAAICASRGLLVEVSEGDRQFYIALS